ncbi:hypothetical protein KUTeg_018241 [Tegillarca granosa]|uniref:Uncharacterized protein n=1 Tax=Tegillarca granosa TaxID=220873 RepID=A0ABQ9EHA3_TEGGR|nr:hypothetical protein KUTeg_018241 [Tegillarca granosa]
MCNKIFILFQIFIYLFLTVNCKLAQEDTEETTECDIKPENTPLSCEKELDDIDCIFDYVAAGGTNEMWSLKMSRNFEESTGKYKYTCTVERETHGKMGTPSYLFFAKFKMRIEGAEVEGGEAFGEKMKSLKPKEYKLDKNSISSVDGQFSSVLDKVTLTAVKKDEDKEEL